MRKIYNAIYPPIYLSTCNKHISTIYVDINGQRHGNLQEVLNSYEVASNLSATLLRLTIVKGRRAVKNVTFVW